MLASFGPEFDEISKLLALAHDIVIERGDRAKLRQAEQWIARPSQRHSLGDDRIGACGNFAALRARTREHIDALTPELEKLDRLIESPLAVNGKLSLDDIRVLPLLRSAAVVKGLRFPHKVREYFEAMMERIGYQPLPAV